MPPTTLNSEEPDSSTVHPKDLDGPNTFFNCPGLGVLTHLDSLTRR